MKHFQIPIAGVGTDPDPVRPNIPDDYRFAGQPHTDATYLIAVPDDSPIMPGQGRILIPPQSLAAEAQRRGLTHANVQRWRVGPPTTTPPGQGQAQSGTRPNNPRG